MLACISTLATDASVSVRADGPAARITSTGREAERAQPRAEELIATLRRLGGETGVRAIVIDATGPAFSAGHDLGEIDRPRRPVLRAHGDYPPRPAAGVAKVEGMATEAVSL